jgi:hypothetical protein
MSNISLLICEVVFFLAKALRKLGTFVKAESGKIVWREAENSL